MSSIIDTVKPVVNGHSQIDQKLVSKQNIAYCRSKLLQNAESFDLHLATICH